MQKAQVLVPLSHSFLLNLSFEFRFGEVFSP